MKYLNHSFIKKWKKKQISILTSMYPNLDKEHLSDFLNNIIEERIVNPSAVIHNNYIHKQIKVDLLSLIDWFENNKPIAGGFGVFYKNQHQVINPAAIMLNNFLTLRKKYKAKLKEYKEDTYEYATFDRLQLTEKINANSYYGASGAPTSNFFNIYTATSVTAAGQSLISTTEQAFEMFLSNSVKFINLDECFLFLENIRKEKKHLDGKFLPNISVEKLIKRLSSNFYEWKDDYYVPLFNYLMNQHQSVINRMYFKNNIYEFSFLPKIRNKLYKTIVKIEEFKDPNKIPEYAKDELDDLWNYYKEFVFYNHFTFGRINRLKNDVRKTVVLVDTDSNMLNLNPWMQFLYKYIISSSEKLMKRDPDQLRFIGINTMCYILTNMIAEVLNKYTKTANIPKEYRDRINMKNEYLFSRLILSPKKKRYISSIRLREGKEIYPEKIDIKGHDFAKSSTREETMKYFLNLVKERLLYVKDINISEILRDLEKFEKIIYESLKNGEKSFLIPKSVKELEAYKDPFKEQGVRAVIAWNAIYPDMLIQLPDKVDIVKVKMRDEEEIKELEKTNPEIYKKIVKNIFNSSHKKIADKGIEVLAIPRNIEKVPEWVLPFIDFDTIVNDNISRFYSVLESLGIETIKTGGNKKCFSNIINI